MSSAPGFDDDARERRVERIADVVDEVRRLVVDRARDHGDRFLLRAVGGVAR